MLGLGFNASATTTQPAFGISFVGVIFRHRYLDQKNLLVQGVWDTVVRWYVW